METVFQIFFWTFIFLIIHSYITFPFSLRILAKSKDSDKLISAENEDLPTVSIVMAVHNEGKIIKEKVESVFKTNYPINKFKFYIGSDCSDDSTDEILKTLSYKYSGLAFKLFQKRTGKPEIINRLVDHSESDILIITDANVIFRENTIYELVKYFKEKEIGLTDSITVNPPESLKNEGISFAENIYILRETEIKRKEGIIWGTMMGPFGGCYAIRRSLYKQVPENFLVDDFYINMNVLISGKKSIINQNAIVYEDVSDNINLEFKRKVRISAGNFQNLKVFFKVLFSKNPGLAYCFFSHKILRWLGPFIFLSAFIFNLILIDKLLYQITLIIFVISFIIPLIDYLFKIFKINLRLLRYVSHFYAMNLALLVGFFKYISGIKSGVWTPTERN